MFNLCPFLKKVDKNRTLTFNFSVMKKSIKKNASGNPGVHPDSLKILVAREYLAGKLSHGQLALKYGLASESTSRYFLKWYQKWQASLSLPQVDATAVEPVSLANMQEAERALFEANLKITALEMMVNKAQELIGEDMGKKFGAKSSKKSK